MTKQALLAAALAFALTACSAAGTGLPTAGTAPAPSAVAIAQAKHKGTARFEIKVPKKKHRRARYVSPSTKSLRIAITPVGGGQPVVKNVNVAGATLAVTVQLNPGKYLATVATYDALNEGGNTLSSGQALPFQLVAGQDTNVTLVLGGVPHAYIVEPDDATGSLASGFTTYGSTAEGFTFAGTDADGNLIIGPGAPAFTIAVTGTGWSVTPKQTSANGAGRFAVTPPGTNGSVATLKIAIADPNLCSLAGSACTTSFGLKDVTEKLYAAVCEASCGVDGGADKVVIFEPPYTGQPVAIITNGILAPTDVAVDKSGNLFVLSNPFRYGGSSTPPSVKEYSPSNGYASPVATMTAGLDDPSRIVVNPSGDVIVMNGASDSYEYPAIFSAASNYAAAPVTIKNVLAQTIDMRVNVQGTLVVASCGVSCGHSFPDQIVQFTEPYSSGETPAYFSAVDPLSLTIDPSGNLWVGECEGCTVQASDVAEHLPQPGTPNVYSSSIENLAAQSNYIDGPVAIAVDASNHLFIADALGGNYPGLAEYTAPYTAVPTALFNQQVNARQMEVDPSGELVMTQNETSFVVSAPPYTSYTPVVDEFNDAIVFGEAVRFALGQ